MTRRPSPRPAIAIAAALASLSALLTFSAPLATAEMATFLHREAGEPSPAAPSAFHDVPADDWFTEPVAWMSEVGATTGTTRTIFEPSAPVTRAEVLNLLWRVAGNRRPLGQITRVAAAVFMPSAIP
ncbi:MAG: hypothetical protein ACI9C1_003002 [Candidatus Aldehydirespiratoraceae bacterium]|jgi:hypothetical protein